ncbi:MAG: hypothetical protein GXO76_01905 [Calditrichaeota bacterium]|nr:hypothetical protein [Calditrichota bacterium]
MRYLVAVSLAVLVSMFLSTGTVNAQEAPSKKKAAPPKTSKELVLKALHVEAHIEKPSVSIVPKRIEPKLKEVEFIRRSFSKEIKNVPRELLYMEIKKSKSKQMAEAREMLRKERK